MVSYRGDRQDIAKMRHKIRIESRVVAIDEDSGEPKETWEFLADMFAGKSSKRGFESPSNTTLEVVAETVFRIRYRPDITEQMRVVHGGLNYNITFVDNVNDGDRFLDLYTKVVK